jgi:hypothetical protein
MRAQHEQLTPGRRLPQAGGSVRATRRGEVVVRAEPEREDLARVTLEPRDDSPATHVQNLRETCAVRRAEIAPVPAEVDHRDAPGLCAGREGGLPRTHVPDPGVRPLKGGSAIASREAHPVGGPGDAAQVVARANRAQDATASGLHDPQIAHAVDDRDHRPVGAERQRVDPYAGDRTVQNCEAAAAPDIPDDRRAVACARRETEPLRTEGDSVKRRGRE